MVGGRARGGGGTQASGTTTKREREEGLPFHINRTEIAVVLIPVVKSQIVDLQQE